MSGPLMAGTLYDGGVLCVGQDLSACLGTDVSLVPSSRGPSAGQDTILAARIGVALDGVTDRCQAFNEGVYCPVTSETGPIAVSSPVFPLGAPGVT